jgi:FdhD protein
MIEYFEPQPQTDCLQRLPAGPARIPPPIERVNRACWRGRLVTGGERTVAEETPVALTYNTSTHAVMMATPADLEDFALGFSLSEGIVQTVDQVKTLEVIPSEQGVELRMFVAEAQSRVFQRRRRYLAGPTGCGICGVESIAAALPPLRSVTNAIRVTAESIRSAVMKMDLQQHLNREVHALHAAAFSCEGCGLIVREDVGRHNALDKLGGALARARISAEDGCVLLSSRVSIEMVQKVAAMGAPVIVAVSAPTALAVRACAAAGLTLVGIVRGDYFEVFTHPERICGDPVWPVAERVTASDGVGSKA